MDISETILSREQIHNRVDVLGRQISSDYRNKKLVLIGILNGAFIFLADLVRTIELEIEVDFIRVASYGDATSTTGTITLSKKPELDLTGKDILLVEDIVDTGTTLAWLYEVKVDYVGFMLNKGFLVGYGLDYAQKFRNLPEVCSMQE